MEKKIKLIWDFYGPDAQKTAEHHEIHLKEFIQNNKLKNQISGFQNLDENHSIAFLVVEEYEMTSVRDALKPNRGEWYEV